MILVTGATGTIGSHVVRLLTDRGVPFRAMSRTPSDLRNAVRADFTDPTSLARAVDGTEAVFLVTAPPAPDAKHDLALLAAALTAGVRKIVKLSAIGSGTRFGDTTVGAWHREAEQAIEDSGVAWTMLRPPSFASNFLRYRELIDAEEPIPDIFGTARQAIVDPRDVSEAAVAALLDDRHNGQRYDLTGPDLLTFAEQATILSQVLNRPVLTVDTDPRTQLASFGMPPAAITATLTGITWAHAGGAAYVTDHVQRTLSRPARTFRQWATDHQAAFNTMR